MNQSRVMRYLISGLIILGLLVAAWRLLVTHAFLRVSLGTATQFQLTDTTGRLITQGTSSRLLSLPTGHYLIKYTQSGLTTSLRLQSVGPLSYHSVSPAPATAGRPASTLSARSVSFMAPLGTGYVFVNQATRGLFYSDAARTLDLTPQLNLATAPNDPGVVIYGTIVNLESAGTHVVVTTTQAVFLIAGPASITRLAGPTDTLPNYVASAYNQHTGQLFALSALTRQIYAYDTNRPTQTPTVFYTPQHQINRLATGGDQLVAYYDAVPSLQPAVLSAYAQDHQITPLLVQISTKKATDLRRYPGTSLVSVAADGSYLALKAKYATSLTLYQTAHGRTTTIPGPTTGALAWQDSLLYLARDGAVWTYDPTAKSSPFTKFGPAPEAVTHLAISPAAALVAGLNGLTLLRSSSQPAAAIKPLAPFTPPATPYQYAILRED